MDLYKNKYETRAISRMYLNHEHPFAYATITDFRNGSGLLQIHSDWGTYSNFWNSPGYEKLEEFLISSDAGYIETKLQWQMNFMGVKKEAFGKLTKFMAQCWPKLCDEFKKDLKAEKL